MNGTHRRDGIFVTPRPTPRIPDEWRKPLHLRDVTPMILSAMGLDAASQEGELTGQQGPMPSRDYTGEEQDLVAARLRALGYLE